MRDGGLPVVREPSAITAPARVLLIEEDPPNAMLIGDVLRTTWTHGLVIAYARRFADASRELHDHGADCVLLGTTRPDSDPMAALRHLRGACPAVPIVVLSPDVDEELGLAAVEAGAQDVLPKSELTPGRLARTIRYAIERNRSEVDLAHRALHDPVTGLPNRTLFLDRLTVSLDRSRRTGAPVAVLFLDVDSFKQVNDSLGHSAGDLVLTVLAGRFREMLRPMDTVARFGGDEFTFLFEELDSEREAILLAQRICGAAARPHKLGPGETETAISVSIGIAMVSDTSAVPEHVIRDADAAMYRAKELGGARFEMFDETSRHRATQRLELEAALRHAVERAQLRVHYQPRVSLDGATGLVGFEALVRWEHPDRGLIEPREFLHVAEDTGLIVPIGEWVLEQALRHIARWRQQRPGMTISVNLSPRQLEDPELVARLTRAIRASGADPGVLCLELTEDTVEHDPEQSAPTLAALRQVGIKLAIDDFGLGRSSLTSLQRLPVDALKLHGSFVAGLGREAGDAAVLGAVVELGHALGLSVIAEGVETASQLAHLRDLGFDGAQGFLFSRPVPEDAVGALLRSR